MQRYQCGTGRRHVDRISRSVKRTSSFIGGAQTLSVSFHDDLDVRLFRLSHLGDHHVAVVRRSGRILVLLLNNLKTLVVKIILGGL